MTEPDPGQVWEPTEGAEVSADELAQMRDADHAADLREPWFDQPEAGES